MAAAIAESVQASGDIILREGLKVPAAQDIIEAYRDKLDGATTDKEKKGKFFSLSHGILVWVSSPNGNMIFVSTYEIMSIGLI